MFYKKEEGFCESQLYTPEYINSVTSLSISYFGYYGLKYNNHNNTNAYLLYSILIINGIMSFLYHWTNYLGFGYLDRLTMVLIMYPSLTSCINEISYLYNYNKKYLLFAGQTYITTILIFTTFNNKNIFNFLFGIFLLSITYFMILINRKRFNIDYRLSQLINNGVIGILLIYFAIISWLITEILCDYFWFLKYSQGHALWHIFIGFGGYLISLICVGLSLNRNKTLNQYKINYLSIQKI
jgi:hypothetical protein